MFGAELGDFDAGVGGVDGFLLHAFHFVAEDKSIFFVRADLEVFEGGGVFRLFDGTDAVAFSLELLHDGKRVAPVFPSDGIFCAEGGFVHFAVFGGGGDAAEVDFLDPEGIGGTEYGADVVLAADVVEHNNDGEFARCFELLGADAVQFFVLQFAEVFHGVRIFGQVLP